MHNAATIAGLGFINSMCSLAHALGHSLGALYNIPHGRCVGLFLPYTIQFNAWGSDQTRYQDIARFLGLPAAEPQQGVQSLVAALDRLAREVGQPVSIKKAIDLPAEEFEHSLEKLVEHAESDTQIITTLRSPSTEDIRKLFIYAYEGKAVDW